MNQPLPHVVIAGGGGVVVLEELEHAKARGAKIYAEILGYGLSSDAKHVSEPDPTGANPARAMRMALADAGVQPEDIDYINAHGTSTPLGLPGVTRTIARVRGEISASASAARGTRSASGSSVTASTPRMRSHMAWLK